MSVNKKKSLKLPRHKESADKLEDENAPHLYETKKESAERSSKRQETPTPLHSTPKKSSAKLTQEQSDLRASPMLLPCTQDGGNEVAWDWQSPLAKSTSGRRSRSNGEHIGTPKRTTLLQKKRNSNSPLLYKPIKRKLMKSDNQHECFETFTAEMKALSEQIKTKDETENRLVGLCDSKSVNVTEDELLIEIDIEDFTESATKPVTDEKRPDISVAKTSMDDLFDDSIEDSMVKCSQEVEEKLRLESCRVEASSRTRPTGNNVLKDFSWHQQSYTSFLASKDNSPNAIQSPSSAASDKTSEKMHAPSSRLNDVKNARTCAARSPSITSDAPRKSAPSRQTNCEVLARSKISPDKTTSSRPTCENVNASTCRVSKERAVGTTQRSEIFEIPDDSFDDDFLDVCFDDVEVPSVEKTTNAPNQASSRYGKFYTSPHASVSVAGATRKYVGTAARKLLPPPPPTAQSSSSDSRTRQDQIYPRTASDVSLDGNSRGVNSTRLHQSQSAMNNSSRKFFKTKSLSTSNFDDSTNFQGKTTTSSTMAITSGAGTSGAKSWKSNFSTKCSSVSNSTIQAQQRKTSPSAFTNNAWTRASSERNDGIENFNRNAPRDDGNRLKMINDRVQRHNGVKDCPANNQSQSTQICTPEEIERKRREAKMKLEMKRKLQARSKSASLLSDFTTNRPPVKR